MCVCVCVCVCVSICMSMCVRVHCQHCKRKKSANFPYRNHHSITPTHMHQFTYTTTDPTTCQFQKRH